MAASSSSPSPSTKRSGERSLPPQPSLLTEAQGIKQNAGPLLGGTSDIEQSPLERLILQSTSDQAAVASGSSPFFIEDPAAAAAADPTTTPHSGAEVLPASGARPVPSLFRTSIITLLAGTLCLLHICLVWASFLSNDWFETHLTITVGISAGEMRPRQLEQQQQQQQQPTFEFSTDQTLQKTTLASLLSMLLGAGQEGPAMVLVFTCLICPCLCMILCPSWTVGDYQEAVHPSRSRTMASHTELLGFNPRVLAEHFLVRICFLAFFLLAILDVGTSSLALENNHSEFLITNRTRGGVVCYSVGMTCALGVVVVLRMAAHPCFGALSPRSPVGMGTATSSSSHPRRYTHQDRPRAPPNQAFRELHRPLLTDQEDDDDDDSDFMENGVSSTPVEDDGSSVLPQQWKRVIVYEFGILASVLWIPAFFLPLFQITFDGIVASFMAQVSFEVTFFQLPTVLLQRSTAAGTAQWALLSLGVVFLLLVYILPLAATACAVAAWRSPDYSKSSFFFTAILRYLQPCLCGFIFSLSLFMAIPTFEPLGEYLVDTKTSGFCQRFENITDTSCLIIHGQHRLGQWFLLAQSVALEIFVLLTLLWKR